MHACVLGSQWPLALKVLEDFPGQATFFSHRVPLDGCKCQVIFGGLLVYDPPGI